MFRIVPARLRALTHSLFTAPAVRRAVRIAAHTVTVLLVLSVPVAASADTGGTATLAVNSLPQVIANLRTWLIGILAAVATLFLVLAGVYWATAGGDPAQVEKAKGALKNALVGYGLAVLAPILLQVVRGIVGG
ncbi:pilin [Actinoplanes sp. NPDC051633]|uniref:pilin n=1 Tax=Actinoplanes sp. NPDC051633 TaxID=3155670 RepID=UPI003416738E